MTKKYHKCKSAAAKRRRFWGFGNRIRIFAVGRGLEPLRAFARRFSRPVPYHSAQPTWYRRPLKNLHPNNTALRKLKHDGRSHEALKYQFRSQNCVVLGYIILTPNSIRRNYDMILL